MTQCSKVWVWCSHAHLNMDEETALTCQTVSPCCHGVNWKWCHVWWLLLWVEWKYTGSIHQISGVDRMNTGRYVNDSVTEWLFDLPLTVWQIKTLPSIHKSTRMNEKRITGTVCVWPLTGNFVYEPTGVDRGCLKVRGGKIKWSLASCGGEPAPPPADPGHLSPSSWP